MKLIACSVDNAGAANTVGLATAVAQQFGSVEGVFLNAGYGIFVPHTDVTAEQYDQQYAVNVRGPILHAKSLSPLIKTGGSLLFNTSVAQDLGMQGGVIYSSTKGALRTVVRVLAAELAPKNIRVNAVSPGPIGTDFLIGPVSLRSSLSRWRQEFKPWFHSSDSGRPLRLLPLPCS